MLHDPEKKSAAAVAGRALMEVSTTWVGFWFVFPFISGTTGLGAVIRRVCGRIAVSSDTTILGLIGLAMAVFAVLWVWRWTVDLTEARWPRWPWEHVR